MKKHLIYLTTAAIFLAATFAACTAEIRILPMEVALNVSDVTIPPGETLTLIPVISPDETTIKTVTWASSNPEVATVVDGVVTAINEGFTLISVTTNSGQKSAFCTLLVRYPVWDITLDRMSVMIRLGESIRLAATVIPEDAPNKTVTWTSSDPNVAEITDGVITAKNEGMTTIYAVTEVGHRIAYCYVMVIPENTKTMTMTLQPSGTVSLFMSGSGTMYIDWGNGNFESSTLSENLSVSYQTLYSTPPHTVTIAGDITKLHCYNNKITMLDVSNMTELESLNCSGNQLTSLDVSNNTTLTSLFCSNNRLTSLDVSKNTALTELNCSMNQLTGLDVNNNTALTVLYCSLNRLKNLDVGNTALRSLVCQENQLSTEGLNALFGTLPVYNDDGAIIWIRGNPGTDNCDRNIATSRGWTVYD